MRWLSCELSTSGGGAPSIGDRVVLARARNAERARFGDADAGTGDVVAIARDGAHVHEIAGLELERVEVERAGELRGARVAGTHAMDDAGLEGEGLALARAHDVLEPAGVESVVVGGVAPSAKTPFAVRMTVSRAGAVSVTTGSESACGAMITVRE